MNKWMNEWIIKEWMNEKENIRPISLQVFAQSNPKSFRCAVFSLSDYKL